MAHIDNFKATKNAQNFMEKFFEIYMYDNPEMCLNGIRLENNGLISPDLSTPDMMKELQSVCALIDHAKQNLKDKHDQLIASRKYDSQAISCPIGHHRNLDFILEYCTICLVTTADTGKLITVNNTFIDINGGELRIGAISKKSRERIPKLVEGSLLGVYIPKTGTIMLWIDRIFQNSNPTLVFQKVLAHELIHAMMDISPRKITRRGGASIICNSADCKFEETICNTLVLRAYSDCDQHSYKYVRDFISGQPKEYRDAIPLFDKGDYIPDLENHLSRKLDKEISNRRVPKLFWYIAGGDDEEWSEEDFVSYICCWLSELGLNAEYYNEYISFRHIRPRYVDLSGKIRIYKFNGKFESRIFCRVGEHNFFYDSYCDVWYTNNGNIISKFKFNNLRLCIALYGLSYVTNERTEYYEHLIRCEDLLHS